MGYRGYRRRGYGFRRGGGFGMGGGPPYGQGRGLGPNLSGYCRWTPSVPGRRWAGGTYGPRPSQMTEPPILPRQLADQYPRQYPHQPLIGGAEQYPEPYAPPHLSHRPTEPYPQPYPPRSPQRGYRQQVMQPALRTPLQALHANCANFSGGVCTLRGVAVHPDGASCGDFVSRA